MLYKIIEYLKKETEYPTLHYTKHIYAALSAWILSPLILIAILRPGSLFNINALQIIFSDAKQIWIYTILISATASPKIRSLIETKKPHIFTLFVILSLLISLLSLLDYQGEIAYQALYGALIAGILPPTIYYSSLKIQKQKTEESNFKNLENLALVESYARHAVTFTAAYFLSIIIISAITLPFTMGFSILYAIMAFKATFIQYILMLAALSLRECRNFMEGRLVKALVIFFIIGFTAPLISYPEMPRIGKLAIYAGLFGSFVGFLYLGLIQWKVRKSKKKPSLSEN